MCEADLGCTGGKAAKAQELEEIKHLSHTGSVTFKLTVQS